MRKNQRISSLLIILFAIGLIVVDSAYPLAPQSLAAESKIQGRTGGKNSRLLRNSKAAPTPAPTQGCTYSNASNYNAAATVDDGSCNFTPFMNGLPGVGP